MSRRTRWCWRDLARYRRPPASKLRRVRGACAIQQSGLLSKKGYGLWWQLTRLYLSGLGRRARRLRRRVFELVYAGYWWALLVAGASIVWCLVLLLPSRRWRHLAIHYGACSFLWLTGLSPKVEVEESDACAQCTARCQPFQLSRSSGALCSDPGSSLPLLPRRSWRVSG